MLVRPHRSTVRQLQPLWFLRNRLPRCCLVGCLVRPDLKVPGCVSRDSLGTLSGIQRMRQAFRKPTAETALWCFHIHHLETAPVTLHHRCHSQSRLSLGSSKPTPLGSQSADSMQLGLSKLLYQVGCFRFWWALGPCHNPPLLLLAATSLPELSYSMRIVKSFTPLRCSDPLML